MPQDIKIHGSREETLEGKTFTPANLQELSDAIDQAFDYRGDITLTLKDNRVIEGFLFNRDASHKKIELFVKGSAEPLILHYPQIISLAFTGEDTANGKSWEAWTTKKETERQAEAEKLRQASLARGEL